MPDARMVTWHALEGISRQDPCEPQFDRSGHRAVLHAGSAHGPIWLPPLNLNLPVAARLPGTRAGSTETWSFFGDRVGFLQGEETAARGARNRGQPNSNSES